MGNDFGLEALKKFILRVEVSQQNASCRTSSFSMPKLSKAFFGKVGGSKSNGISLT